MKDLDLDLKAGIETMEQENNILVKEERYEWGEFEYYKLIWDI